MVINISQISDSGLSIDYSAHESVASSYLAKDDEVAARIFGVVCHDAGDDYVFSGNFEITCTLICDKCLKDVKVQLSSEISEKFSRENSEACQPLDARHPLVGDSLDFTEVIRANICALLPMKISCADDCLGLCPMCGKNLNKDSCECEKPTDPRFAHLSSFFKEEV